MSDREFGKKEAEAHDLDLFLREHLRITGIVTRSVCPRERPDFEVAREDGTFGLELTQVVESPDEHFAREVLSGRDEMRVADASDTIQEAIYQKEEKRKSRDWGFPMSTILVVQLRGCSGEDVFRYWDDTIIEEVSATGFVEIWLCDHSPVEPYGTVKLTGVKPIFWLGVHPHPRRGSKPYG